MYGDQNCICGICALHITLKFSHKLYMLSIWNFISVKCYLLIHKQVIDTIRETKKKEKHISYYHIFVYCFNFNVTARPHKY